MEEAYIFTGRFKRKLHNKSSNDMDCLPMLIYSVYLVLYFARFHTFLKNGYIL